MEEKRYRHSIKFTIKIISLCVAADTWMRSFFREIFLFVSGRRKCPGIFLLHSISLCGRLKWVRSSKLKSFIQIAIGGPFSPGVQSGEEGKRENWIIPSNYVVVVATQLGIKGQAPTSYLQKKRVFRDRCYFHSGGDTSTIQLPICQRKKEKRRALNDGDWGGGKKKRKRPKKEEGFFCCHLQK